MSTASHALLLRKQRREIVGRMSTLLSSTAPSAMTEWRSLDQDQQKLADEIERIENAILQRAELVNGTDRRNFALPNIGNEYEAQLSAADQHRSTPEYRKAFETFVRSGGKESYETRALSSSSNGQTLIPLGFEQSLEEKLKSFSGMRQACRILQTATGTNLVYPKVDDTGSIGSIIAESQPVTTQDPTFSSVTLSSSLISSKEVIVPIQVLQDSAINLEEYLANAFGVRIGRRMEAEYTNGVGTIEGLLPALVTATGRNVMALGANANSGNAGDTELTSVGTDDLGNLVNALDPAYTQNAAFMANASTWNKIRRQLDRYGRSIWQTSVASGEPDTVWGKKFYYNQQMDAIGAGNKSMIFGDFSKYILRDSLGVTFVALREKYIENHQIAFLSFTRTDGKLLQPNAFVYLQHPLS